MSSVGIIGGSGLYEMPGFRAEHSTPVKTPFGEPSAPYVVGVIGDLGAVFLPRHGQDHRIPPHRINYRANIWGFRELGVERIISVNAAGGISPWLSPGDIVVLDQVIDLTMGARESTFFDKADVYHVDFTEPYCPELRQALMSGGKSAGVDVIATGTYVCVNGPRLESRAEIEFFGRMGADVIGMTGMPEAGLAREAEICYSAVSVVTNSAAGLSGRKLTSVEVVEKMKETNEKIKSLLASALPLVPAARACQCREALKDAGM